MTGSHFGFCIGIEKGDQKKKAEESRRKSQEKLSSSMPDIKNNSIPQMRRRRNK